MVGVIKGQGGLCIPCELYKTDYSTCGDNLLIGIGYDSPYLLDLRVDNASNPSLGKYIGSGPFGYDTRCYSGAKTGYMYFAHFSASKKPPSVGTGYFTNTAIVWVRYIDALKDGVISSSVTVSIYGQKQAAGSASGWAFAGFSNWDASSVVEIDCVNDVAKAVTIPGSASCAESLLATLTINNNGTVSIA